MSGLRSKCSEANHRPVRPNPDWTSSATSSIPSFVQSSRSLFMKPSGGTTYPPSPRTGSITAHATSPGEMRWARTWSVRKSKHSTEQVPGSRPTGQR